LRCKACSREAGERDFCPLHLKAYENIVKEYDFWRKGLKISWKEYLSEIEKNSLTGEWAKEVAKYLINNEEVKNVKKS
jgi:predicted metal-binding protein